MPFDVETRLARIESAVESLGGRLARAEKCIETMAAEQHTFYMRDWPPVQIALQNVLSLRGDVSALRDEAQRLHVALITNQSTMAALPQQLQALAAALKETETKTSEELHSIKRFVWMLTGGLIITSFAAQTVAKFLH